MRDLVRPFAMVNDPPVRPESGLPDLVAVLEERVASLVEQRRDSLKLIEELRTRLAERDAELRRAVNDLADRELVRDDLLGRVTKLIEQVTELERAQSAAGSDSDE